MTRHDSRKKKRCLERDTVFFIAKTLKFSAEKPTDQIITANYRTDQDRDQQNDPDADEQFELAVSVLIRRRKLVLRKIWRRSVHNCWIKSDTSATRFQIAIAEAAFQDSPGHRPSPPLPNRRGRVRPVSPYQKCRPNYGGS